MTSKCKCYYRSQTCGINLDDDDDDGDGDDDDACLFVFCKHQTRMMKVVIQMIREIENVYKEKPLIRSLEYEMGLWLCNVFL